MCMSPHEMSSAEIERDIDEMKQLIAKGDRYSHVWAGRIENLEAILKERADNGTYHDDFSDKSGTATARQGRADR